MSTDGWLSDSDRVTATGVVPLDKSRTLPRLRVLTASLNLTSTCAFLGTAAAPADRIDAHDDRRCRVGWRTRW